MEGKFHLHLVWMGHSAVLIQPVWSGVFQLQPRENNNTFNHYGELKLVAS
jgi:hypothetical protein